MAEPITHTATSGVLISNAFIQNSHLPRFRQHGRAAYPLVG